MKRNWELLLLVFSLVFAVIQPPPALAANASVNANKIRIRTGPGTSFQIIGYLNKNVKITVLQKNEDWYNISYDGQTAWINSQYVSINKNSGSNNLSKTISKGLIGNVTVNRIHIHNSASFNSSIAGTVYKNQSFPIIAEHNNWTKIEYRKGKFGWIASWYLDKNTHQKTSLGQTVHSSFVTILEDGSNIRNKPDVHSDVIAHAKSGHRYPITKIKNDWYEIKLKNGTKGFVAGWMVSISGSAPRIEKPGIESFLKDKTIVIDPGHGGQDDGTTGPGGTLEKNLTYRTANLVIAKLKAAGANAVLTRKSDSYVSLSSRVNDAESKNADAFVSLHYDSSLDWSNRGMTGYYYRSSQKPLAESLYSSVLDQTRLNGRGVRFGDYHVIRENSQKATLMELGYLSNPEEEIRLTSRQFQENVANGIFLGLTRYFMDDKKSLAPND